MNRSAKTALIVTTIAIVGILGAIIYFIISTSNRDQPESATPNPSDPSSTSQSGDAPALVRDNSHVLDDAGEDAIEVVEFLDFECEACGAFYPVVEDLREKYAGEITYVVRYFPLPGHFNSMNAAIAAESAANQGRFEDMYNKLFETQQQWGEAQVSQADFFRQLAEEIGLDMEAYDTSVADPLTQARVETDFKDARSLDLTGTPTFFVNGTLIPLETLESLEQAIVAASDGSSE